MSANLVVDLENTTWHTFPTNISQRIFPASGGIIGATLDLIEANTYTNMLVMGGCDNLSGQLRFQVQSSDVNNSGDMAIGDVTSGLAALPQFFSSGGIVTINSGGLLGGIYGPPSSGRNLPSVSGGFVAFAAFQRPGRFVRVNVLSGDFYAGTTCYGIVAQLKTTGSGGGFTYSPSSGSVSV